MVFKEPGLTNTVLLLRSKVNLSSVGKYAKALRFDRQAAELLGIPQDFAKSAAKEPIFLEIELVPNQVALIVKRLISAEDKVAGAFRNLDANIPQPIRAPAKLCVVGGMPAIHIKKSWYEILLHHKNYPPTATLPESVELEWFSDGILVDFDPEGETDAVLNLSNEQPPRHPVVGQLTH